MTAALAVARKGWVPLSEVEKAIRQQWLVSRPCGADEFIAQIRARLTRPAERMERNVITIERWIHDPTKWIVLYDGCNVGNYSGFKDRKDAERYAAGLRAELLEGK
jgi:hypothetical protein